MVPVTGWGANGEMCRTLATSFTPAPDESTFRKQRLRHADRFAVESLGCVYRNAGDHSTATVGPLWADVVSLCWFNSWVVAFEDDGRRARGRARHPLPFDVI